MFIENIVSLQSNMFSYKISKHKLVSTLTCFEVIHNTKNNTK